VIVIFFKKNDCNCILKVYEKDKNSYILKDNLKKICTLKRIIIFINNYKYTSILKNI